MKNKLPMFLILFLFFVSVPAFAEDIWDEFSGIDNAWDGQQSITNKEFNEVLEVLEEGKNKKKEKQRKKLIKKVGGGGTSLHKELSPEAEIKELSPVKKNKDGSLLNIPVALIVDDNMLEQGFYKVIVEKDKNDEVYINFYQAHDFKGKVKAFLTNDDYGEDTIDFVKLIPYNEKFVKIIYGSLDYNAYTYIKFKE